MIIEKQKYLKSKWLNGLGETLQLAIQPENSDFKLQQFECRISVASLTTSLSPFSQFINYQRWLLVLQGGPVAIQNKSKSQNYQLQAQKGIISFDGADSLQSRALSAGEDFNFFLRKDKKGGLKLWHFQKQVEVPLQSGHHFIYNCSTGAILLKSKEKQWSLNNGQLFKTSEAGSVFIQSQGSGSLIHCFVQAEGG